MLLYGLSSGWNRSGEGGWFRVHAGMILMCIVSGKDEETTDSRFA